ncbi:hypothetical protein [Egicoccus sp. AB-alg6-2]|uniref:hypothetical protein n=1 Tax=Egicoccus sp. AB-alg6-2 TaxID=3242692 RepID=UPI00359CE276
MGRALSWLGAGVFALALLVVATAPELVGGDPAGVSGLLLVVLLAGVPGLAVIAVAALRRRGSAPDDAGVGADGGNR